MNLSKFKNLQSPYILILVGPPLVGKSFFVKEFLKIIPDVIVISRDQILLDVAETDDFDVAWKTVNQSEVNRELKNRLVSSSEDSKNVIVDMTNLTSKRRRTTLDYFGDEYTKIAVIFPILDWDEFIRRNTIRKAEVNKNIPEHVIKNMISSYQPIKPEEGFSKVISI